MTSNLYCLIRCIQHGTWLKSNKLKTPLQKTEMLKSALPIFKTIDHCTNANKDRLLRGWLNDQVRIVAGILTYFFLIILQFSQMKKTASCLWKRQVKLMKLLFKILSLKVINASFQIIQADAQKGVRAGNLWANESGLIAILNQNYFCCLSFHFSFYYLFATSNFRIFLLEHFSHFPI